MTSNEIVVLEPIPVKAKALVRHSFPKYRVKVGHTSAYMVQFQIETLRISYPSNVYELYRGNDHLPRIFNGHAKPKRWLFQHSISEAAGKAQQWIDRKLDLEARAAALVQEANDLLADLASLET